ncbi:pimeloyl-ACP methyl ester carboxylesterase [Arcanobacterium pluranimalium]|uniref:alpha/beta fold hydrolase n=1 Tax=Arcanobacterium pluranimalium TaxID=108028 RepID=UPI00195C1939|nr:alpha/beta hydrolase [Arcanobacterium pluranimalium]MBM7825828.1 pimeloyl-ACP methyl ester carboxylesterase [Arcanobacterium pluranimalium]
MTTLAYRRTGQASDVPLLLLHALPLDSSMWDGVRGYLGDLDVLTVDAPGFGKSVQGEELGDDEPSIRAYSQAIADTLEELGIEKVALGGLSMGGSVAADFVAAFPHCIAGLALMDTNITADDAQRKEFREQVAQRAEAGHGYETVEEWTTTMLAKETPQAVRDDLDARFRALPDKALAWIQRAMANREDQLDAVSLVDGPVYLIRGSQDATCSLESLMNIALRAKQPRIVEIEEAGHFTADEKPEELAQVLAEFYSSLG